MRPSFARSGFGTRRRALFPALPARLTGFAALAALALSAGCQTPPPLTPAPHKPKKIITPPQTSPIGAGPEVFPAVTIDDLDDQDAPHFFARGKDGALLVFVRGGRFLARAAAPDGTPRAQQATDLGAAPAAPVELVLGTVAAVGDGYVFAWAEHDGGRTKIAAVGVDGAGASRGARANLSETGEEVWAMDILPREGGGGLVVWETRPGQSPREDVYGAPVTAQGAPTGPATALVSGVLQWHASPSGAAIAAVNPVPGKDDGDAGAVVTGKLSIVLLDANGKPKLPIEVSASPTAQPDVVVSDIGGRLVLAWTDMRDLDAAVWTAALDKNGTIAAAPKRATPPTGEQALVAATGAKGAGASVPRGLLAWEDILRVPQETRQIRLATLGPDGAIGKERATLPYRTDSQGDGPPADIFSADAAGFGAVTLAPVWQGDAPADAKLLPTFVRFGPDLSVLSAEPVRGAPFGEDRLPASVQFLECKDGACNALAIASETPSHAAIVSLASRKSAWVSPAHRDPDDTPPRAASLASLYNGASIARVAGTELAGGGTLAAWVTYSTEDDPSPRNKKKDGSAEVALTVVPAGAKPGEAKPISLSKKAVSVGGIAVAPSEGGDKKEIAIAWVAREKGESQVYVTKVDETGKKLGQKKLTVVQRAKKDGSSEASDVAIAWAGAEGGDGWIVSWVDTRDGNAEVYAARIDRNLTKNGPDRRITEAAGDAAEVHLFPRGKETYLAWSDARQKDEGRGDIYVTRVETRTLNKLGAESRLAASASHSRSPQLVAGPSGSVWATWVEEPDDGDAGGSVRFAVLDDKGAATVTTKVVGDAEHVVVSAAIACGDKGCHVIVGRSAGDALLVQALDLSAAAQPGPEKTLLTLPGVGSADISPLFSDRAGTSLLFAADAASGLGRVRQLKIDWQ